MRCDEIQRILASLTVAERRVEAILGQLSARPAHWRSLALSRILQSSAATLQQLRDALQRAQTELAVQSLRQLWQQWLQTLPTLHLSEPVVEVAPAEARQVARLLPGLGAAISGPQPVRALRLAAQARQAGDQAAALAWSLQAGLDGFAGVLRELESLAAPGGAAAGAGLQVAVLVVQLGCLWSAELSAAA